MYREQKSDTNALTSKKSLKKLAKNVKERKQWSITLNWKNFYELSFQSIMWRTGGTEVEAVVNLAEDIIYATIGKMDSYLSFFPQARHTQLTLHSSHSLSLSLSLSFSLSPFKLSPFLSIVPLFLFSFSLLPFIRHSLASIGRQKLAVLSVNKLPISLSAARVHAAWRVRYAMIFIKGQ
jgi:hypothetical protein